MKKSGIINRHVKRKIAAAVLASMFINQFPVSGFAGSLNWETEAGMVMAEQAIPEEAAPAAEEQTVPEEAAFAAEEQAAPEETAPAGEEQEVMPENAGAEGEAAAGGEDIIEAVAGSQENVSYVDGDGIAKTQNATVLTESETELAPGWYVVKETINYGHSVILNGSGNYHIILADGGAMNIGTDEGNGIDDGVGLGCLYDNDSKTGIKLNIYGQQEDTGELNVYVSSGSPEGRPQDEKVGDAINVDEITINGGKIDLYTGGSRSYGINTKNLTVNDGTIDVYGSIHGINSTGNINVNGGSLTVRGGTNDGCCGINCTGDITINGGEVTAAVTGASGHAINSAGNIVIKGGTINAGANGKNGHAINSAGSITITGGTIAADATVNFGPIDNGGGWAIYSEGDLTVSGGEITARSGGYPGHAVVVGDRGAFTINGGKLTAVATGSDGNGLYVGKDIIINGGEIKADSTDTSYGEGYGIFTSTGNIKFNGGRVSAQGVYGIKLSGGGNVSLDWKNETDYVSTNSFSIAGNVTIGTGKTFTDGKGHYYVAANASAIKGLTDVKLSPSTDPFYTVTFDCGEHGTIPPMQLLKAGSKVAKPTDPAEGSTDGAFTCAGWYQDAGYQIRYDFDHSKVTSDLYLHAKWAKKSNKIDDASVKMIYRYENGSAIYPVVENNIGETLVEGQDYTVTITSESTHSSVNSMKDAGFYNLTVTGKGSYSGKQENVRVCVLKFGKYNPSTEVLDNNATLPAYTGAAVVTADTVYMDTGWYVVTGKVKVSSRIRVRGDVHLVLCDGAELDAGGDGGSMGISVTEGNSLTIYSQAGNTGKLKASSNEVNWYAGIGGDAPDDNTFPYLGQNKNAGNITIHGGEIITRGSHGSAAIGMAQGGKGGKITIYGGKVTATRYSDVHSADDDTGIGGPNADIHISWCRQNDDYILSDGYQGTVTFDRPYINGNTIVTRDNINNFSGQKIVPTESAVTYTVSFDSNGGSAVEAQAIAGGKKATKPVTPIKPGNRFGGWYKDAGLTRIFDFDSDTVGDDLTLHAKWAQVDSISYLGSNGTVNNFINYSPMEADYTNLISGNYYVGENVSLLNRVKVCGNVSIILGDGKTLTAGKGISVMDEENTLNIFGQSGGTGELSANAAENNAAIGGDDPGDDSHSIVKTGNINIYGGIIRPQGGNFAASIGGGRYNRSYGRICIYGGTISGQNGPAMGGEHGSAIGGGYVYPSEGQDVTGTVEIRGGKITVNGNSDGTGIGGGENSCGGEISILGGQVYVGEYLYNGIHYPGIGDGDDYTKAKKARITLGCREGQDDFIYSDNYSGNVRVAPNHALKIKDTDTTFQGNISDRVSEIAGKTLVFGHVHKFTYTVNDSTGTVTARCENDGCDLPGNPHTATLTLSAPDAGNPVYDGTYKPASVSDVYHISGDEVVHYQKKNGSSWGEASTAVPMAAGDYRASITLPDMGYGTATVSVIYTIKQRNVTISGLVANDKIYDDTTTASVNDADINLGNKVDGDDVVIIPGNADFASADAGENKNVTFTNYRLGGTAAGNYNLASQPAPVTAAIRKRPVTITAIDQTVQFGDAITEMAATFDHGDNNGLLVDRGHALTALTLTPDPDPRYTSTPVENGTIAAAGAVIKNRDTGKDVTDNYNITYENGSLKIIMIRAKVTKHPVARTNLKYEGVITEKYEEGGQTRWRYGGQPLVDPGEAETKMEYKVEQISRGKGELLTNKDGSYVRDNAAPTEGYGGRYVAWESGSYHVWYRAASDNSHAPSEPICLSVDIAQVPLTVRPVDETIAYGERFPSMNAAEQGLVDKDDHGRLGMRVYSYLIDGEWKKGTDILITRTYPDPGTYSVSVNYDEDGEVYHCYDIHCVPGFLTVKPRTVSLNWGNTSFTYDGKIHVPTVMLSNLSENEVSGAVGAVVAGAKINAGDYTAAAVALSGDKADKYALPSENTVNFSIAKANYRGIISNVEVSVPVSADSFTASVAGKLDWTAGELTYEKIRTISTNGFQDHGGIKADVDQNGLVTVTIDRKKQDNIKAGNKLFVCPDVDSTNYNTKSITVEATFADKKDAGVRITEGNSLSVNYREAENLTLKTTVSNPGTNAAWIWESSNTGVAEAAGNGETCNVTIKGVGTTAITAKYDSAAAIGYATIILTVNPLSVPIPMAKTGLSYNGSEQTGVAADDTYYTLTGETGTKPGNYVAAAALKDTGHCRWSDGTIDVKYISWSIEKQPGPSAPTGLMGISPTTAENIDGKITGVNTDMEYSKDAEFGEAFPCTGTVIIGLTPGIWYVRVRETDTEKAGAAAAVKVVAVAPPVVRPIEGLVYNGSPQVLVTADTISAGKIYYATAGIFDAKPDAKQYSTTIPTGINAGTYRVYYEIQGAGETTSAYTDVKIAQMDLRNDLRWVSASFNGLYGSEGMIDVRDHVPADDVRFGGIYRVAINNDTWGLLGTRKSLIDLVENYRVYYKVSEDKWFPETERPKCVPLTISMDEMQNYHAFNLNVRIYMYKECSTNHADIEPLNNYRVPDCTEKGYTGDVWCHDCHAIMRGEDIPVVPNAHDFDYSAGEVTKPPTTLAWGWHTYHCIHNKAHTITKQDIPPLPSDDGRDYTDFAEDTRYLSGNAGIRENETVDPATGEVTKTVEVGGDEISKIKKDPNSGKETVESKIWVTGLQSSYPYTGAAIKPSFHVYDGTRKLTEKQDYSVQYKDNKEAGTAKILLKFKGNFKGTKAQTVSFSIVPAVLGKDILAYDAGVAVKNKDQKPVPALIWASTGKAVSSKFFTVSYDGADHVRDEGTYTAVITSKNKNYEGTATAKVRVVGKNGPLLSKATVTFSPKSYEYTGSAIIPAKGSYTLKLGGRELVEGTDYRPVKVINNIDAGTAAIVFEGIGTEISSPAGTKTASFKITGSRKLQEAGNESDFTYSFSESVPYVKGGAKPGLIVQDKGVTLTEGKDYTLSYTKNKAVTNGKKAEIKVKGKGNYTGSIILKFRITKQSLNAEGITIEAADQFTTLGKLKKPSLTVTDTDGTKLKAGTDYVAGEIDLSAPGNTDENGEVFITVTGKGNYSSEDPVKTSFRYMAVSSNLFKAKRMHFIADQVYTGCAVYLGNGDLNEILYTGSKKEPKYLVPGKDFVVNGYKNNLKQGTAKVILKGIGDYAGTKTLTFRIKAKTAEFQGVLRGEKWQDSIQ